LENNILLYVKSEKISIAQYTEGLSGHPCTAAFRAIQVTYNYKPEDQKAMDLLKEAGIAYKVVDLSDCSFMMQLKAKMFGINETPTLILNGVKVKGLKNIKKTLQEIRT
jgi:glutaredoxin